MENIETIINFKRLKSITLDYISMYINIKFNKLYHVIDRIFYKYTFECVDCIENNILYSGNFIYSKCEEYHIR